MTKTKFIIGHGINVDKIFIIKDNKKLFLFKISSRLCFCILWLQLPLFILFSILFKSFLLSSLLLLFQIMYIFYIMFFFNNENFTNIYEELKSETKIKLKNYGVCDFFENEVCESENKRCVLCDKFRKVCKIQDKKKNNKYYLKVKKIIEDEENNSP